MYMELLSLELLLRSCTESTGIVLAVQPEIVNAAFIAVEQISFSLKGRDLLIGTTHLPSSIASKAIGTAGINPPQAGKFHKSNQLQIRKNPLGKGLCPLSSLIIILLQRDMLSPRLQALRQESLIEGHARKAEHRSRLISTAAFWREIGREVAHVCF